MLARYYQTEAIDAVFSALARPKIHPLVCMPGGSGKSFVISDIIRRVVQQWPSQRIMSLVHVKELIAQNSKTLERIWTEAPFGIYSAGLKSKQSTFPIIFGGIGSVVKNVTQFGHRDLLLIDEAHLLSDKSDTMYHRFIAELMLINPLLRVIGFTATPYRIGQGLLTDEGLFNEICYDITGRAAFNRLIDEGYLSLLIPKRTTNKIDTSNLSIGPDGDFNKSQLEDVSDNKDLNYQICKEMCYFAQNRNKWLVFAAGVTHAKHIAEMLCSMGIPSAAIYASMGDAERDRAIADFKNGKLRCLVNNNVLTTGFDFPPIDFIGMLRATTSPGLWVQMLSRGTRPSPETQKENCLCLDFAGNTLRLGPINDPIIPRKKGEGTPGPPPIKICPMCGMYNHTTVRVCEGCGFEFPILNDLTWTAGTLEIIAKNDLPLQEWFNVDRVVYSKLISKENNIPYLKTTYICFRQSFSENVLLEHPQIKNKYKGWWQFRMNSLEAPPTVDEALKCTAMLKIPKRILVHVNKKYPKVMEYEW